MMNNYVIFHVATALIIISSVTISNAQWTPDPFCPYPSEQVTRYPLYGNCSVFWECFEGTKYVMECPEGLEFNAPLQQCDAPEIAKCDPYASTTANPNPPTFTTGGTTNSNEPGPVCPFPSEEIIYFPYSGDCTKYWECFEGNKYLYNCPDGLWWHQEISQCDYPGSFCNNGTTPPITITPVPRPDCSNYPPDVAVFFPYEGDCTKYWECSGGEEYVYTCPDGLWWHQEISECDYPGSFCNNGTTGPTPPTLAPAPDCSIYPPDVAVFFSYAGDCTKYWECSGGKAYVYSCPDGLWWHQEISECDYPGSFCNNGTTGPTPPITITPQPAPDCSSYPPDVAVFFSYVGDCTKYWECSGGKAYVYSCPDGLWWHQEISECDYPGSFCTY